MNLGILLNLLGMAIVCFLASELDNGLSVNWIKWGLIVIGFVAIAIAVIGLIKLVVIA